MTSFMAILPTWQFAALFVGASVLAVVVATVILRRSVWYKRAEQGSAFMGLAYPMIGAIFGVVLAFTIVLSWQRFAEAETYTASEVTHLSSLWRNSQVFDCDSQQTIEQRLLAYASSVVDCEWQRLASVGESCPATDGHYENIWEFYRGYDPGAGVQHPYTRQQFYEAALRQLNELGIQRRLRIMSATSEISGIVWLFLMVGGVVTVVIPMFVWTRWAFAHVTVNGVMAFIVAFSLWIVASLQYPYSGDVSVSNAPYETLIKSFRKRQEKERECP